MHSNFSFFETDFPALEKLGSLAVDYLYSDPNTCLYKMGALAEMIVDSMFELDSLAVPETNNTLANRIKKLQREGMLPYEIGEILYTLRTKRNEAVHEGFDSFETCVALLELAYSLSVWFMQTYGDYTFEPTGFVLPEDNSNANDYEELLKANETLAEELEQAKAMSAAFTAAKVAPAERKKRSVKAVQQMNLSEKETRILIDEQLRKVGWEADTDTLRHAAGTRPVKGRNIAIAEWPTDSVVCKYGSADYALFIGLTLVGVIEAKAINKDIPAVIDNQCREYSMGIRDEDAAYLIGNGTGNKDSYKAPFLFATNGRPYLKQLEIKSGIWFRDARDDANIPRALQGWYSPQNLLEMLEKDVAVANASLTSMPNDLLRDKDGLNLRPYQIEAIERTETAITSGRESVLLAMATGTGKTRTVLGMIYRFLKTGRFRHILFLVDRTTLGEQAQDVFREVKLEELMTLDEIYNIKNLDDKELDPETRIQVATVQSLVKRILYSADETSMLSVGAYDLIVVDEAHRGYLLDREMGETEILYRNQQDFVSKYRMVIEYFDAVKIALTATPALHTTEIFGKPVFEYSYRRAVIEGFLVDHDAPHDINTELRTKGIHYDVGDTIAIYDPVTGEVTNSDELEDELDFDIETFNRRVITEPFNRTVLKEISLDLNPEGDGKTLIYAVDDNHADLIVRILRETYEPMGVSNDAIMKITGSIGGGNSKKVLEAVKRFKNEKYPNIAVTVDLLTTGIDVPEITSIVFMRRVKSRILFEQMMGRATRLCPEIGKTHFEIYDPVGVYESLSPVNTMKPVSQNESATLDELISGLDELEDDAHIKYQIDLIVANIRRKNRNLREDVLEQFIDQSGGLNPTQLADQALNLDIQSAKKFLIGQQFILEILDEGGLYIQRPVVLSDAPDHLLSHTRGYGGGQSPEDYLDEFNAFITDNINEIAALKVVCSRPKELTREGLKGLKLELDRHNFTEQQLNTAWNELKNEDIAADIISFIRRGAIGSALISHEDRIKNAVDKLRKTHNFTRMESDWLSRIESSLLAETVIDKDTFNAGAFQSYGGFDKINKVFSGNLELYLKELNDYLYDDGGKTA
jgi:type I restriction enzyme R subunit